jgi:hypothetical protein
MGYTHSRLESYECKYSDIDGKIIYEREVPDLSPMVLDFISGKNAPPKIIGSIA